MNVSSFRLVNARALADEFDTLKAFAEHCGMRPVHMSRLISKASQRNTNIGSKAARQIETACSKPPGWLDINHSTVSASQISAEEIAIQFNTLAREVSIMIEDYTNGKMSREDQLKSIMALKELVKSMNSKRK